MSEKYQGKDPYGYDAGASQYHHNQPGKALPEKTRSYDQGGADKTRYAELVCHQNLGADQQMPDIFFSILVHGLMPFYNQRYH
jgi:hypothetical protein